MKHTEKERLAGKLTTPMRDALHAIAGSNEYFQFTALHASRTVAALVARGLIRSSGNGTTAYCLTALGREVARIAFGAGTVRSLDELHAEALDENDTRVASAWQATPAYLHLADTVRRAGSYRAGVDVLHAEASEDPRQRAERHHARACCASTLGDVHNRTCNTIEARKQWAPAGSAHGEPQCSEACRARNEVAHLLDCPRGVLIKARGDATRKRNAQVKAWEQRHGLFAPSRYEAWRAVQADHAEALAAMRPGQTFRATAVTPEEFERACAALGALPHGALRANLRDVLASLGMVVQP